MNWGAGFEEKESCAEAQAQVLAHATACECDLYSTPTREDVADALSRLKDSAPGPDGLVYSAWKACGDLAVDTLHRLVEAMLVGCRMGGPQLGSRRLHAEGG